MTVDIARHLRIARPQLDDDFVEKRTKAIAALAAAFRSNTTGPDILSLAESVVAMLVAPRLEANENLRDEIAEAISAEAPSFVSDEASRLESAVCCLLACATIVDGGAGDAKSMNVASFSAALACGLESTPPVTGRLEALRSEVQSLATTQVEVSAVASRKRTAIRADVPAQTEGETSDAYAKRLFQALARVTNSHGSNAALDREEIDLLWWTIVGRSRLLDCATTKGESRAMAVAVGVEVAQFLANRMPIEAHLHLATRDLSSKPRHSLADFATINQEQAKKLGAQIRGGVRDYPSLFPLLCTILNAAHAAGGSAAVTATNQAHPPAYWARRAVRESCLASLALG